MFAFSSAVAAPFVFDDIPAIDRNPSIGQLIPISAPLNPPRDTPVAGRPVVNVSLAINYAINDLLGIEQGSVASDPRRTISYHIFNILIHCLNGLLLFAVIRRTVRRFDFDWLDADRVAGIATLLWILHPIQTESVDYTIQRTELLVSTFYLLTLYCAIRAWPNGGVERGATRWTIAAVLACAAGMASKEVMITAPVMVILYDRVFAQPSWAALFRDRGRRRLYASLFATSIIVLAYVATGVRGHSVGFGLGVSWYEYLRTQMWAVARYLRLLVWPIGLTFDYGDAPVGGPRVWLGAAVLASCVAGIAMAWRRPRWQWLAFAGVWFFLILAPSSSIIPIKTEIAAERRVYLASASLFATAAVGIELVRQRLHLSSRVAFAVTGFMIAILGLSTFARGLTFLSQESLYADVVEKAPTNPRGYVGLGLAEARHGPDYFPEAASHFRQAISLDSNSFAAWQSLGILSVVGAEWRDAADAFRHVFRIDPGNLDAAAGMARAEVHLGELDSAAHYVQRIGKADPEVLWMIGEQLMARHRERDALPFLERSADALPRGRGAALLGVVYAEIGDTVDAIEAERIATKSTESVDALVLAAEAMRILKRTSDAKSYLTRALEIDSTSAAAHAQLDSLRR